MGLISGSIICDPKLALTLLTIPEQRLSVSKLTLHNCLFLSFEHHMFLSNWLQSSGVQVVHCHTATFHILNV
jgi:hypothetical protein